MFRRYASQSRKGVSVYQKFFAVVSLDTISVSIAFYIMAAAMRITATRGFADILSVGMTYDSPFAKCDPFVNIHEDDKKVFKMLVEKIIFRI